MRFPASATLKTVGLKSTTHKLVLSILADHADNRTWKCNPSIARIAELAIIGERHTQKVLRDLERDGFISRIGNSLGGPPGCTCIYLVNQELVTLHLIKSRFKKEIVSLQTKTPAPQNIPTAAWEDTPRGAHSNTNPCSTEQLTPVLQSTLTTNELYITKKRLEDFVLIHGKDWKGKPGVVRELGEMLGIKPMRNEGAFDYADRLERGIK